MNLPRWLVGALLLGLGTLLGGCGNPAHAPPAGALQDVQSIEIRYQYSGWDRADEVHRLQPAAGRRTFRRSSQLEAANAGPMEYDDVPAQRVGELLWAVSAPAWSRERGVEDVARRLRPAQMLDRPSFEQHPTLPACTPRALQRHLRAQVDRYYNGWWTDDDPSIRVVITYKSAPAQVISSRAQTLLMLPWVLGDTPANDKDAPRTWSVPISQALRRVLPTTSKAYARLGQREDARLEAQLRRAALEACEAQQR